MKNTQTIYTAPEMMITVLENEDVLTSSNLIITDGLKAGSNGSANDIMRTDWRED